MKRAVVAAVLCASAAARGDASSPVGRAPLGAPPVTPVAPTVEKTPDIDAAALEAGDANLESTERRRGTTLAFGLGGGFTIGMGVKSSTGRGGGASFRVGRVATRRTVFTLELAVDALLHRPPTPKDQPAAPIATNTSTNLLAGAQYFVGPSVWVRAGLGYGVYSARDAPMRGVDFTLRGVAGVVGAGADIVRWKSVALDLEFFSIAMVNKDGVLTSSAVLLALAFD